MKSIAEKGVCVAQVGRSQHAADGGEKGITQHVDDAPEREGPGVPRRSRPRGRVLRRLGGRRGNGEEVLGLILDQQGEDEMGQQPGAGECLALRRQAVEAEQGFQPLECEFDSLDANDKPGRLPGLAG